MHVPCMYITSYWEFPKMYSYLSYLYSCVVISRSSVLMSRRTEEVPYHLKRAEKREELEMVLLDIDLLIVLHYRCTYICMHYTYV